MNRRVYFVVIGPYEDKKNSDYVVRRIREALGLPAYLWRVPTESEARKHREPAPEGGKDAKRVSSERESS